MDVHSDLLGLEARLAERAEAHAHGRAGALADALAPFREPPAVRALLKAFLEDEDRLRAAAGRSYVHPNGFTKIVLSAGRGHQLRLHIWWQRPGDAVPKDSNVHNHRWDFSSVLITGGYRYQEFLPVGPPDRPERRDSFAREPSPGEPGSLARGTSFRAYAYGSADDSSSYSLLPRGSRRLELVFDAFLSAGTGYALSADILHRVLGDPSRTTASLVFQGRDRRPTVDVFAEAALKTGPALALEKISPRSLAGELSGLLACLTRPPGPAGTVR